MISYKDIENVNKDISTTEIKGSQYAAVSERIKAFRKLFPEGFIRSEMISNENGVCIFKAEAGNGDTVFGVGFAYEKEGSSFINKTSYIENCQTSAVGRALGMCGIGIDTDVASADEVQTATFQQDSLKPITAEKRKALEKSCKDDGIPVGYICELYSVSELKELTEAKFVNLVGHWDEMKAKYNERKDS